MFLNVSNALLIRNSIEFLSSFLVNSKRPVCKKDSSEKNKEIKKLRTFHKSFIKSEAQMTSRRRKRKSFLVVNMSLVFFFLFFFLCCCKSFGMRWNEAIELEFYWEFQFSLFCVICCFVYFKYRMDREWNTEQQKKIWMNWWCSIYHSWDPSLYSVNFSLYY